MLPKKNRLTKKTDFDAVFKNGKSIKTDFSVWKVSESHLPESRFGFVVSKKVSNKAIVRNKVKRRLRSIVFAQLKNISLSKEVVVVTLPGIEKKEFSEIQDMVSHFFKKIRA